MEENEYFREIEDIRKLIRENALQEAQERLEDLQNYKPVRMLWNLAKAELTVKLSGIGPSWEIIAGKQLYGIVYPGLEQISRFHIDFYRKLNNPAEAQRLELVYRKTFGENTGENENLEQKYAAFAHTSAADYNLRLRQLMWAYYMDNQIVIQQILRYRLIANQYLKYENRNLWFYHDRNIDYLEEKVCSGKMDFILLSDGTNDRECDLLASVLKEFGHSVVLLTAPVVVNGRLTLEESIQLSFQNSEAYPDATVIPVIEYFNEAGRRVNNLGSLLLSVCEEKTVRNFAVLLTTGNMFLKLLKDTAVQKHVDCLSVIERFCAADKTYFGWVGDYCAYISDIYGFDAKEELEAEPEYDFSIIIPARNSSGTLEYTLKTCLNQDYQGRYEIVVSDNSSKGNDQVYNICQSLNDKRIKYFRTPRNLTLNRSFEYAFLKSRGSFVFSLGSDDGVCSYALSVLAGILEKYPEEQLIQWERGYFSWKGFADGTEGKLVIPGDYIKEEYGPHYVERVDYFSRTLKYTQNMYILPLLYINSGCKRSYMKVLLERTGRLWDGGNQDIYMGVINAAINDRILNLHYPLTIAGASNNSLGYVTTIQRERTQKEEEIVCSTFLGDNVGNYAVNGIVADVPMGRGESYSLYMNLFRAIQLGVLPELWLTELFDYKKIYWDNFQDHTCLDVYYDTYIHYARKLAESRGTEFLRWFDEEIYLPGNKPKRYGIIPRQGKTFREGMIPGGGFILDALKYGAGDIVKALEVFERYFCISGEQDVRES